MYQPMKNKMAATTTSTIESIDVCKKLNNHKKHNHVYCNGSFNSGGWGGVKLGAPEDNHRQ